MEQAPSRGGALATTGDKCSHGPSLQPPGVALRRQWVGRWQAQRCPASSELRATITSILRCRKGAWRSSNWPQCSSAGAGPSRSLHGASPSRTSCRPTLRIHSAQHKLRGRKRRGCRCPESLRNGSQKTGTCEVRGGETPSRLLSDVSEVPRPQARTQVHPGSGQKWLLALHYL